GGGQGVLGPAHGVFVVAAGERLGEALDGGGDLAVQARQVDGGAPGAYAGDQRQEGRRLGQHRVARRQAGGGRRDVLGGPARRRRRLRRGLGLGRRGGLGLAQVLQGRRPEDGLVAERTLLVGHREALFTHQSSSLSSGQSPATCTPSAGAVARSRQSGDERSSSK